MLASTTNSGDNSQTLTAAEFLAGSNDTRSSQQFLQPNSNDPDNANSNTSKKKSMERISQLFQKKSKKKSISSSLTPSFSSVSLSSPPVRASVKPNLTSAAKDMNTTIANNCYTTDTPQPAATTLCNDNELSEQRPSYEGETKSSQDDKRNDEEEKASRDSSANTTTTTTTTTPTSSNSLRNTAPLKTMLACQRQVLEDLKAEHQQYEEDIKSLTERVEQLKSKRCQRSQDLSQLKANYDTHVQSLRATGDDLHSVRAKIEQLKQGMQELAAALVERADHTVATRALATFWLNLNKAITDLGCPLSPQRLQMLTEKFMMDVLVQNLNLNVFPGLDIIDHYNQLQYWLEDNYTEQCANLPTRLRQEIALVIHKTESDKNSQVYKSRHTALQNNWKYLYSGLVKAYPFVYQHDKAEPDVRKHYGARVQMLVEQAISLGLAIKGQEEDITAAAVAEGEQSFDPETMIDEDGQNSGTVVFCICPPFVVGNLDSVRTLLKGRVLCTSQ
ncbi:hypothetical protein O0I10_004828 [Lichtheimia ornata]|uniref:Uncharacterized protein n=1 Tax=Lichtheimia ornata TaxID=688661 RepID=A0AAD7V4Z4_9FUNG|nr:uncharacterized protein O0I10_004828 [Lichtheimia ornata]KAJ8659463.1 hypothetical protein O0I10_004828 [Lichtheimia ornata]